MTGEQKELLRERVQKERKAGLDVFADAIEAALKEVERCERLEEIAKELLGQFAVLSPMMNGKHVWRLQVRNPTDLRDKLLAALKEQEG